MFNVRKKLHKGFCGGLALTLLAGAVWAVQPAADLGATSKKKLQTLPAGELRPKVVWPKIKLPAKPWKVPSAPLAVYGNGVSLYYLLPYDRVQDILPTDLQPFPGPDTIWFRVDFIQWTAISQPNQTDPRKIKKFSELAYRFEVKKNGERGTYPLVWYADSKWPVLWTRQHGGYMSLPTEQTDVNYSPMMVYFLFRRGPLALASVDVRPRQGVGANVGDLFSRKEDLALWEAGGHEFIAMPQQPNSHRVVRQFKAEISSGELQSVFLRDAVEWQLIDPDELANPQKVFILDSIQGLWLSEKSKQP